MPAAEDGTPAGAGPPALGHPRVHFRTTDSTNERARELAGAGAPHGTLVTASEQTAGRGRQGRRWWAPPGSSLLMSVVLRTWHPLVSLAAGVAVADAIGEHALLKWPNDVVFGAPSSDVVFGATQTRTAAGLGGAEAEPGGGGSGPGGREAEPGGGRQPPLAHVAELAKAAGVLVEGRPQDGWLVLGIGINVAVEEGEIPQELRGTVATLGRGREDMEEMLGSVLLRLSKRLHDPTEDILEQWRRRDALLGADVRWSRGEGRAEGVDASGRLIVRLAGGGTTALDSGEVHLA